MPLLIGLMVIALGAVLGYAGVTGNGHRLIQAFTGTPLPTPTATQIGNGQALQNQLTSPTNPNATPVNPKHGTTPGMGNLPLIPGITNSIQNYPQQSSIGSTVTV